MGERLDEVSSLRAKMHVLRDTNRASEQTHEHIGTLIVIPFNTHYSIVVYATTLSPKRGDGQHTLNRAVVAGC